MRKTDNIQVITNSLNALGYANFSQKQVSNRIEKMNFKPIYSKEVKKPVRRNIKKLKTSKTTNQWSKEEDFDLLCNFYELSIHEARFTFKRTYGEIASRLEYLYDSRQPEHTSLLMEAAKVVKDRKAKMTQEAQMGFWIRRKIRRNDKKVKRLQRQLNKKLKELNENGRCGNNRRRNGTINRSSLFERRRGF